MRRVAIALGFLVMTAGASTALADQPASLPPLPAPTATPAPAPSGATATPAPAAQAPAAVVATSGSANAAAALAKTLGLGAPVPPESAPGVTGEDPASATALTDLAHRLNARSLVVVHMEGSVPVARVFHPDTGTFDATTYVPDDATTLQWGGAAQAIAGTVGMAPAVPAPTAQPAPAGPPLQAPALAMHEEPALTTEAPKKRAFYESGWFWGALGAAAFAAGAVYFATRDNGPVPIHLEMQVPH